jgi:hypothetical protein
MGLEAKCPYSISYERDNGAYCAYCPASLFCLGGARISLAFCPDCQKFAGLAFDDEIFPCETSEIPCIQVNGKIPGPHVAIWCKECTLTINDDGGPSEHDDSVMEDNDG